MTSENELRVKTLREQGQRWSIYDLSHNLYFDYFTVVCPKRYACGRAYVCVTCVIVYILYSITHTIDIKTKHKNKRLNHLDSIKHCDYLFFVTRALGKFNCRLEYIENDSFFCPTDKKMSIFLLVTFGEKMYCLKRINILSIIFCFVLFDVNTSRWISTTCCSCLSYFFEITSFLKL